MTRLVLDASMAITIVSQGETPLQALGDFELVVPPLFGAEVRSVLHRVERLGVLDPGAGRALVDAMGTWHVRAAEPEGHGDLVWDLADRLGWEKSYDAEYLALASALGCGVSTADRRMARAATSLGIELVALQP